MCLFFKRFSIWIWIPHLNNQRWSWLLRCSESGSWHLRHKDIDHVALICSFTISLFSLIIWVSDKIIWLHRDYKWHWHKRMESISRRAHPFSLLSRWPFREGCYLYFFSLRNRAMSKFRGRTMGGAGNGSYKFGSEWAIFYWSNMLCRVGMINKHFFVSLKIRNSYCVKDGFKS